MRTLIAVLLLLAAVACLYGFIVSFEPGPRSIPFRIAYMIAGVLCLVTSAGLVLGRRR